MTHRRVVCPNCGDTFMLPLNYVGHAVCARCGRRFRVPHGAQPQEER